MYDPSIGRWLEEDPTGFQAGDANLYRYVGNDVTNATDPSGLDEQRLIHRYEGKEVKNGLKDQTFPFMGGMGTVSVYTDVEFGLAKDNTNGGATAIELEFIVKNSTEKNPVANLHWLQFARKYKIRKSGQEVSSDYTYTAGGRYHPYQKWAIGHVDTLSNDRTYPFYDGGKAEYGRSPTEISIFDEPTNNFDDEKFKAVGSIFDAYLVGDGQVFYHVHWERNSEDDDNYVNISGERTDRLPWWARDDKLLAGFTDQEMTNPVTFDNPFPKGTRQKWAIEDLKSGRVVIPPIP